MGLRVPLDDLRVRMSRSVSCQVALAARLDSFHPSPNGEQR